MFWPNRTSFQNLFMFICCCFFRQNQSDCLIYETFKILSLGIGCWIRWARGPVRLFLQLTRGGTSVCSDHQAGLGSRGGGGCLLWGRRGGWCPLTTYFTRRRRFGGLLLIAIVRGQRTGSPICSTVGGQLSFHWCTWWTSVAAARPASSAAGISPILWTHKQNMNII